MDSSLLFLIILIIWLLNNQEEEVGGGGDPLPPTPPEVNPTPPPPTEDPPPATTPISIPPVTTPFQSWFTSAKNYKASNLKNQKLPVLDFYFPALTQIKEEIGEELQDNQRGKAGIKGSIYWGTILGLEGSGIDSKTELKEDFQSSLKHLKSDAFSAGKMTYSYF